MIRVAIIGCGNIGKAAYEAVGAAPDFELAGVVKRNERSKVPEQMKAGHIVTDIGELEKSGKIDVALLCMGSRDIAESAPRYLARGISTVDSYDMHGSIWELRAELDICAKANNAVAVISAGWDPGLDSVVRVLLEAAAPQGITYTDFGPGMSMGHTVAVKAIAGVRDALSVTVPTGAGVHRRMVYIELEDGYDFGQVAADIKNDAYFVNDDTHVILADNISGITDMGHGVSMKRKGVSGAAHNQMFEFGMRINNPALTGQFMLAAARAAVRQKPGCYTVIEIPPVDFLYGGKEDIIRRMV